MWRHERFKIPNGIRWITGIFLISGTGWQQISLKLIWMMTMTLTLIWYFSARSSVLGCKSWSSVSPMPVPVVYMSTHRWLVLLHAYAHVLRRRGVKSTLSHPPRSLRLQPPTTGLQLQEREWRSLLECQRALRGALASPRLASPRPRQQMTQTQTHAFIPCRWSIHSFGLACCAAPKFQRLVTSSQPATRPYSTHAMLSLQLSAPSPAYLTRPSTGARGMRRRHLRVVQPYSYVRSCTSLASELTGQQAGRHAGT
jgi:hypothetical protein